MHLVFLNQKGNQRKLEALEMESNMHQHNNIMRVIHQVMHIFNGYFYKKKSFI